jgi:hypothetical protein
LQEAQWRKVMSNAKEYNGRIVNQLTATIAISTDTSDAVDISGCTAIGFVTPAALTTTSFTFLGSQDKGVTFVPVKDQLNALVTYTVGTSSGYSLDVNQFAPYDQIKFVAADGNEAAQRLILLKPFAV